MTSEIGLRLVTPADAAALLEIYGPYVETTAISFEYETPTEAEFRGRIEKVLRKYPYLAAVQGNRIVGYAYAAQYGERKAFSWALELSVYVDRDCRGCGIGRLLYSTMEALLKAQNVTNLYALVAGIDEEDEYLTLDSVKFHEAMGYEKVGHMRKAGYKFGHWYDMLTFEKIIAEHPANQPEIVPFSQLDRSFVEGLGVTL